MRKWMVCILAVLLLCGCGAQPTFETVNDEDSMVVSASVRRIELTLPKEAAKPAMESSAGDRVYLCDGYTLCVQTFSGGDLDRTLRQLTGYSRDQLQLIQSKSADALRYDLAWSAAGEGGDQVGRAVILDDGKYHYALTVMAEAKLAGQLQETWQTLLGSAALSTD